MEPGRSLPSGPLPFETCTRCQGLMHAGTSGVRCPRCGALYHEACYAAKGCANAACGVGWAAGLAGAGKEAPQKLSGWRVPPRARWARESPGDRVILLTAAGIVLGLATIGAAVWLFARPEAAAGRALQAGLQALGAGDSRQAREHFTRALEIKPELAEAALCLGFAHLGYGGGRLAGSSAVMGLFDRARWGQTRELDAADAAFAHCIAQATQRPLDASARGGLALSNRELVQMAYLGHAITALVRAGAAYDTQHLADGDAWIQVTWRSLDLAEAYGSGEAIQSLRELARDLQQSRGQTN